MENYFTPFTRSAASGVPVLLGCLFFISSFLTIPAAQAQMQGTYTIGGTDGDFANFSEAVAALETDGISAAVTFKVRPGTYEEQISINEFSGNSCNQPVVFEGASGHPVDVVLESTATPFTVQLNGADGISFRNMSISGSSNVVEISEGSDCIMMENNILRGTSWEAPGIIVNAPSTANHLNNHHIYRNNQFSGGTIGLHKTKPETWQADVVSMDEALVVEGNEFNSQREAAVQISGQQAYSISENRITTGYGSTGISVRDSWYGREIRGNIISISGGGSGIMTYSGAPASISENRINLNNGGFGMRVSAGLTEHNEILVANNLIEVYGYEDNYEDISFMGGLFVTETNGQAVKIFHNAVRLAGRIEDTNYTFSANGDHNSLQILNNSFINFSIGSAVSINSSAVARMDYNNILGESGAVGWLDDQFIRGLDEWQRISGFDQHSITVNPDNDHLHEAFQAAGIFVDEVTADITGKSRENPPSIGAIEMGGASYRLSGTYTIGGSDGDYAGFTEAIHDLETRGVLDSVLFLVRPGHYREQLTIRDIDGAVVFRGASGDSTDVILEYPAGYAVHIIESNRISFQHLTISGAANAIHISGSSNILFENNILKGSGGENNWGAVVGFSLVNQRPRVYTANTNNTFRHNRIIGEYQGIEGTASYYDSRGGYTIGDSNLEIEGNIIETGGTALSFAAQSGLNIRNNTITVDGANAINLGFENDTEAISGNYITVRGGGTAIANSGNTPTIMNNRILLPDGGTGIHFNYGAYHGGTVANNMIALNSSGGSSAILVHSGSGINFYFNSVLIYGDDASSMVVNFDDYVSGEATFYNNIFANTAGGMIIREDYHPDYPQWITASDYNNFYTTGDVLAKWHNEDIPSLAAWQAQTGFDQNSLSEDPQFESTEHLIPANPALFNAGISLPSINTDFYGNFRQTPPDLGAVENEAVPLTPLAGTYTIGGENPDFANFNAALDAMALVGIAESVTFSVRPGIYEEPLELSAIPGNSCEVPVIFEGDLSDSTAVVLNTGPTGIRMEGVNGVTFRYMEIERVNMQGGNNCITFEHNHIRGQLRAVPSYAGAPNNFHIYRNNNIGSGIEKRRGGNFNPDDPDFEEGLEITGNTISSVSFYTSIGIDLEAQKDFNINNNTINVQAVSRDDAGISLTNSWYGKEIRGNTISVKNLNGYGYGIKTEMGIPGRVSENIIVMEPSEPIELPYSDGPQEGLGGGTAILVSTGKTTSGEVLIANNEITVQAHESQPTPGSLIGIHILETLSADDIIKMYHNTVATSGYKEGNWPEDQSNALLSQLMAENSLHILNNIFSASDEGYNLHIMHPSSVAISDYNLFEGLSDSTAESMLRWGDQDVNSLAAWQALTGMDTHSITSGPVAGAGIKVEEVDFDIEGRLRNDPPSIGAVEIEGEDPAEPVAVIPFVECVVRNSDGSYTATFGYENPNQESIELAVGNENFLNLIEYAGQPASFAPGRHERVFHVVFEASTSLAWTLGDTTVTVDRNTTSCDSPVQPVEPMVECISELNRTISLATMGYHNPNDAPVAIATGRLNRMFGQQDQGQPTVFEPGRHQEVFAASYTGALMWTLGRERARVDRNTPSCSPSLQAVQPILECVSDNGDGTYTAYFGYHNPNDIAVSASFMFHNLLLPASSGKDDLPVTFEPGRHERVFSASFRGQRLEWRLMGNTATATRSTALACGNAVNGRLAGMEEAISDEEPAELLVYPNFFSKEIKIRFQAGEQGQATFRIYSLTGALVAEEAAQRQPGESMQLNLQHLKQGAYILEVHTTEYRKNFRIFKQ